VSLFKVGDVIICYLGDGDVVLRLIIDEVDGTRYKQYKVKLKESDRTYTLSCRHFENHYQVLTKDSLEYALHCPTKWL